MLDEKEEDLRKLLVILIFQNLNQDEKKKLRDESYNLDAETTAFFQKMVNKHFKLPGIKFTTLF